MVGHRLLQPVETTQGERAAAAATEIVGHIEPVAAIHIPPPVGGERLVACQRGTPLPLQALQPGQHGCAGAFPYQVVDLPFHPFQTELAPVAELRQGIGLIEPEPGEGAGLQPLRHMKLRVDQPVGVVFEAGIKGPHVTKVEHADMFAVIKQVARARVPVEPAPAGQLPLHLQHLGQIALVELMYWHAPQPGRDQNAGAGRTKAGADHVGENCGMQLAQRFDFAPPLQFGEESGLAIEVGDQRIVAAPLEAPVMAIDLEMKHLGGKTVTIDLDHRRMGILEFDQLRHGKRTVTFAPDPDLLLALKHTQQSGLPCHHLGIHTCTSCRY